MRFPSLLSIFCGVAATFGATTSFVFADEAVRGTFNKVGSSSGFKNVCGTSSCVPTIVGGFINLVLGVVAIAVVGYIFYAGYLWMTSGGEEKNIEEAQQVIRNAVIGVVVIGLSFTIANLVLQVVTDTFQPTEVPAEQPATAPGSGEGRGEAPPPPPRPAPYINPSCRRSSCTSACILAEACASRRGQAEFTCETDCSNRCQAACALDGAGLPAPSPSPSTSPPALPASCRNPSAFRTCQAACAPAATARVASITDPTRRTERYVEELFLCQERCTIEHCR